MNHDVTIMKDNEGLMDGCVDDGSDQIRSDQMAYCHVFCHVFLAKNLSLPSPQCSKLSRCSFSSSCSSVLYSSAQNPVKLGTCCSPTLRSPGLRFASTLEQRSLHFVPLFPSLPSTSTYSVRRRERNREIASGGPERQTKQFSAPFGRRFVTEGDTR